MAAGAWYSGAGIGDANQALVTRGVSLAIDASVKNIDFVGNPVMGAILARDQGLGNLLGALGVTEGLAVLGNQYASAAAEGTENAPTNTSESDVDITPARKDLVRQVSDYARSLQDALLTGELSPSAIMVLILDGYRCWVNTVATEVIGLAGAASYDIGTTLTALTWADMYEGTLDFKNRGNPGPCVCALTVKGVKDLAADALSLGGAVQMSAQVQQFLNAGTSGSYMGRYFGSVDIYISSECDAPAADDEGIMFSAAGIATKHQRVPFAGTAAIPLVDAGFYRMELRRGDGATDKVVTDMYNGFSIRDAEACARVLYIT